MRLEDWQKYLESQFVEAPETEAGEQLPLAAEESIQVQNGIVGASSTIIMHLPDSMLSGEEKQGSVSIFPAASGGLGPERASMFAVPILNTAIPDIGTYLPSHLRETQPRQEEEKAVHVPGAGTAYAEMAARMMQLLALPEVEGITSSSPAIAEALQSRAALIDRLINPVLTLEETARLLNVCAATVRRYNNRGILKAYRKEPVRSVRTNDEEAAGRETRQRRFRLADVMEFLEKQQADEG